MGANQLKDKFKKALIDLRRILKDSPWGEECEKQADDIISQLDQPCILTVAGMVKAGKSSFINAFLEGNYAAVGTKETTATINFFCYDENLKSVPDKQKPVQCVYSDEPPKWVSQSDLDSLQGNDVETLNKSMKINRLEFFLDNPVLKGIRLVDTPGIGAISPNDAHNDRTLAFVQKQLRDKHSKETVQLAEKADALIYLASKDVINEQDYKLITGFLNASKNASDSDSDSVLNNVLVIMGKADENQKLFGSPEESQKFLHEVSDQLLVKGIHVEVVAVSAGMEAMLKRIGKEKLRIMHQELQSMSPNNYNGICEHKNEFLKDSYYSPNTAFTIELRNELVKYKQWNLVKRIAQELRNENDFEKAYKELERKSGFNQIRELLKEKFFERGEQLRYMSQLCSLMNWVYDIQNNYIRSRLDFIARRKIEIGKEAATKPLNSRQSLKDEYDKLDKESKSLQRIYRELPVLYNELIEIQHTIEQQHKYFDALNIVKKRQELFSDGERMELEKLFTAASCFTTKDKPYLCQRAMAWRIEKDSAQNNERRIFAKIMEDKYRVTLKKLGY